MRSWPVLVFVIACGGGSGSSRDFCKAIDKLCSPGFTDQDIQECSDDIPKLKGPLGEHYDKLLSCTKSDSCAELIGCTSGALAGAGEKALEDFERGFGKTFKKGLRDSKSSSSTTTRKKRTGGPLRRGEPLPPQCKRFDAVCNEDKDGIERSDCLDRVDELKADATKMQKLVTCYEAATTCAAFAKCSTDMWFEIH